MAVGAAYGEGGEVSLTQLTRGDSAKRRSTVALAARMARTSSKLQLRVSEELRGISSASSSKGAAIESLGGIHEDGDDDDDDDDEEQQTLQASADPVALDAAADAAAAGGGGGGGEAVPEGWSKQVDPASGHPYYYNHEKRKSVWDLAEAQQAQ